MSYLNLNKKLNLFYRILKHDKKQINLYWDIGNMIVTRQQNKTCGKSVVRQLAKDLQTEF